MNILFFLTPKEEVAHVEEDDTLRQVVEKLEYHGYSAIPLLGLDGRYNEAVKISESMENLFEKITNQNFVPVVDDNGIFIGIVTRKDILLYLAGKIQRMEADAPKN